MKHGTPIKGGNVTKLMVFVICHWFGYTFSNKKQDFLILLIIQNGINIRKMMQILQFKKKKKRIIHSFSFMKKNYICPNENHFSKCSQKCQLGFHKKQSNKVIKLDGCLICLLCNFYWTIYCTRSIELWHNLQRDDAISFCKLLTSAS